MIEHNIARLYEESCQASHCAEDIAEKVHEIQSWIEELEARKADLSDSAAEI